ncbi:MAG: YegP family protein [Ignavibacteriaceae bacterium]
MAQGKFQIYKDKSGKFRFRLLAGNLQPVLSSEGYNTKAACKNGITSVKKNAANKDRYVVNKAKNGKVYFSLTGANKAVIGNSQMYKTRDTLRKGRDSVIKNAKSPVEEV